METVAKGRPGSSADSPQAGERPSFGLPVRVVLTAAALAGARVLAGAAGLDRLVARLNVMEVPDILPWVKPAELLLTTGYPLRHDPDALVGLVAELDRRGLAALVIKLHRYLDEVPPAMLAEADRRGFPIIELPDGVGFDDVLTQVYTELLNRQAAVLARSEEVHRVLVSVVLAGGDLADLATELARLLPGPVLITSPEGLVLAQAGTTEDLADLAATGHLDPAGRLRPAGTGGRRRPHTVVPIVADRVDHGRIVVFGATPLTEADVHGLERAATVAALAITKRLAVAAVENKYRADFLRDVLTGRLAAANGTVGHASGFGWRLDRPTVVLLAALDPERPGGTAGPGPRPLRERFAAAWRSVVTARDPAAPVADFADEVVCLLGAPRGGDLARLAEELHRQVRGDSALSGVSFSVGLSRVVSGPDGLPEAYRQAGDALRIGRRISGPGARTSFDQLGAHRLLALIPDGAELRGFVTDTLGELAAGTAEAADLRRTLAVLLDTSGNVAQAARELHFHYNTLRYRIGKLERLLGPFTTTPALRLDLALALRVLELREL